MKYLLILLALTGCASNPSKVETQIVNVPITLPCKTAEPTIPSFNVPQLKQEDDVFVKVRGILADLELHKGYEIELLAALRSCK